MYEIVNCVFKAKIRCYNNHVTAPTPVQEGGVIVEVFISFLLSVAASVIAYYICKWLDEQE
ncbi:MAG: hypothetical protein E7286_01185 [Lachnospiraceae bacterium]|nr:hypothetical protein [Lachnospiraceae bacterium]